MVFIVGCNQNDLSNYDDNDVAAIVRGEEITVGDLRFLYSDDKALESLDGTIKAILAEQEAKDLNLDLTQELQKIQIEKVETLNTIFPHEGDDTKISNGSREFADAQSAKLGMEPEEYYEEYFEKTQKMVVYVTAYTEEKLGEPLDNTEEYMKKANELLDKLVEENQEEIQILIK